ncbi:MAG: hypothetical protein EB121_08930, partial [Alphaproteobacteria bacterium]|nr:hypothetical protein [Alphaproteobacteria bacterium]
MQKPFVFLVLFLILGVWVAGPQALAAGGGGGIEFFSGGSVFVKTQPILMPIIDEYGPQQFVTFVVAVEVKD